MVVDQTFDNKHLKEVHNDKKEPNMRGFQLLNEVFDIKTMLK
jgi:hypothetical protein